MKKLTQTLVLGAVTTLLSCGEEIQNERQKSPETKTNESLRLINGTVADLANFPASVQAVSNGSSCTATVVGPKVLMIASHCVNHGARITFKAGGSSHSGTCSRSTLYRRGVDHDLAFCRLDNVVANVPYESVNTDPNLVTVGTKLLLTGYGCRRPGGSGGSDGQYRIGESGVTRLPDEKYSYDIVTQNGGALCYGDSGGPAFLFTDEGRDSRVVVSVNSKGNISNTSYLTSTASKASLEFIRLWSESYDLKICGVHQDVSGCRESSTEQHKPGLSLACQQLEASDFDEWQNCLQAVDVSDQCHSIREKILACSETKGW